MSQEKPSSIQVVDDALHRTGRGTSFVRRNNECARVQHNARTLRAARRLCGSVSWHQRVSRDLLVHALDDAVIFASGDFGANFANNSLFAQVRLDVLHLPTTNGEHCTSARLIWVKPDDPDFIIKFFAAKALRGVDGLVSSSTHSGTALSMSWEGRIT